MTQISTRRTPKIAITLGDPSGIGPEVVAKAIAALAPERIASFRLYGSQESLERAESIVNTRVMSLPGVTWHDCGLPSAGIPFGRVSALGGEIAYRSVASATTDALKGIAEAVVTAPLNKEALHEAGRHYPGHTELLADLCGVEEVSMLLTAPGLRVVHVTTHIGLLDAVRRIEPGLVERTISRGHAALQRLGLHSPRIAVCGINPHAGENGLFGAGEEAEKIVPAVQTAQANGWQVEGPLPADTLFFRARRGDYDLVVAMYHDQGHGPVKVLGLEAGVNITLGLPFVRTSVDHGTAYDIAGRGIADPRSMVEAIHQAIEWTGPPGK